MSNRQDEKMRKAMLESSEDVLKLKGEIWMEIEKRTIGRKKKSVSVFKWGMPLAASLMLIFGANTEAGKAFVKDIKSIFAPERTVEVEVEGTKETKKVNLAVNESASYVIYVDEETYVRKQEGTKDRIEPKTKAEGYPEVSMVIEEIRDQKPEALIEKIRKEAGSFIVQDGKTDYPLVSHNIRILKGNEWDSPVENYYFFDNGKSGVILVKQSYFLEASEGHGARMDEMLKSFEIVK